jgi:hypothetical protein
MSKPSAMERIKELEEQIKEGTWETQIHAHNAEFLLRTIKAYRELALPTYEAGLRLNNGFGKDGFYRSPNLFNEAKIRELAEELLDNDLEKMLGEGK